MSEQREKSFQLVARIPESMVKQIDEVAEQEVARGNRCSRSLALQHVLLAGFARLREQRAAKKDRR